MWCGLCSRLIGRQPENWHIDAGRRAYVYGSQRDDCSQGLLKRVGLGSPCRRKRRENVSEADQTGQRRGCRSKSMQAWCIMAQGPGGSKRVQWCGGLYIAASPSPVNVMPTWAWSVVPDARTRRNFWRKVNRFPRVNHVVAASRLAQHHVT